MNIGYIVLNIMLKQWKIKDSDMCSFCYLEVLHIYFYNVEMFRYALPNYRKCW